LRVLGEAAGNSPAPVVTEAVDTDGDGLADQLDPDKANPAHVTIDYPGMALYDSITLILEGKTNGGAPARFQMERQINTVEPLSLSVPQPEILRFLDGGMDVYYQVAPFSKRSRAFIRALSQQESERLVLSVRRDVAELPLPAPTVKDDQGRLVENGGTLDPTSTEAVLQAPVYEHIVKGDEITYRWLGTGSTRTQTYKVTDPAKPPADYAGRDFIVENTGGKVVVSYSVRRLGADPIVPSETLHFIASREQPIDFTIMDHGYIPLGTRLSIPGLEIKALPGGEGTVYLGPTPMGKSRGLHIGYYGETGARGASVELTPEVLCREVALTVRAPQGCYFAFYRGGVKLHEEYADPYITGIVEFSDPLGISHMVLDAASEWCIAWSIRLVAK
jgi:hypothetical protein